MVVVAELHAERRLDVFSVDSTALRSRSCFVARFLPRLAVSLVFDWRHPLGWHAVFAEVAWRVYQQMRGLNWPLADTSSVRRFEVVLL